MADVFISYKKKDKMRVEGLVKDLEAEGFTVWWDYEIESGENWLDAILKEVAIARCMVGVWTPSAVAVNGTFIPSEKGVNYIRIEHEEGAKKLVPVQLEDCVLPIQFRDVQASDLKTWSGGRRDHPGFRALVKRIEEYATPSWVQTRLTGLEARFSQEEIARRSAEARIRALEQTARDHAKQVEQERAQEREQIAREADLRAAQAAHDVAERVERERAEASKRAVEEWHKHREETERAAQQNAREAAARAAQTERAAELRVREAEQNAREAVARAAHVALEREKQWAKEREKMKSDADARISSVEESATEARAQAASANLRITIATAAIALTAGACGAWMLKPAPARELDIPPPLSLAQRAADLTGTWGGGDFPCVTRPLRLSLSSPQTLLVAVGKGARTSPTEEALQSRFSDWLQSNGAENVAPNFWLLEGENLRWRSNSVDNELSEQRLSRCTGG